MRRAMSLILKGIDIPKDGYIPMRIYANGHIWINGSYKGVAIQIPKGHGRIGDLDELQKAIRTDIMGGLNYEYFIRNAPTILEAEE